MSDVALIPETSLTASLFIDCPEGYLAVGGGYRAPDDWSAQSSYNEIQFDAAANRQLGTNRWSVRLFTETMAPGTKFAALSAICIPSPDARVYSV